MNTATLIFATRYEAEYVLNRLITIYTQRGVATVGDLFSLACVPKTYMDENWGWRDLLSVRVIHSNRGYILSLPKPEDIRTSDDAVIELYNSLNEKEYLAS